MIQSQIIQEIIEDIIQGDEIDEFWTIILKGFFKILLYFLSDDF